MALFAGLKSQESRIELEGLIADDARLVHLWMPWIEQDVTFDSDDCGRYVQSRTTSALEPRGPECLERFWSRHRIPPLRDGRLECFRGQAIRELNGEQLKRRDRCRAGLRQSLIDGVDRDSNPATMPDARGFT